MKAKNCQKDLESTLVEVEEDKENVMERLTMVQACPLPAAVYRSGTLSEEQLVDVTGPEYAYIPEAYGTVNTSAKVTKHVARVRVGQAQAGLKWNENCLVSLQYLQCVAMPLLAYNLCTLVVLPCILALLCFNVSITLLYCNVH